MEATNATLAAGEKIAVTEPVPAVATAAATTGTAEPQRRRRPTVAFHVTGFGVFNGVPDNPTTHLIDELPGQLRGRPLRGGQYDDDHAHSRRERFGGNAAGAARGAAESVEGGRAKPPLLPAFGGEGEGAFEVRSCQVLHVSAEVGGRQVRELHAATSSLGSSTGREWPAAAPGLTAEAAAAAVTGAGGSGSGSGSGSDSGSGSVVGLAGAGNGAEVSGGHSGSGIQGKSADEGGGPGDSGCVGCVSALGAIGDQPRADGGDGAAVGDGKDNDESGSEERGFGGGDDDDDAVTVFVHCGVNGGTDKFALETQGFNEADFRVPDERGYSPSAVPIESALPKEHCRTTTVPVADVLERLGVLGWGPEHVAESNDAGRFVCNYVYYTSLGLCEASPSEEPAAADETTEGQHEKGNGVFCFSGAGAGAGGRGGSDGDRGVAKGRRRGRRHSMFIHVPPFEAVPKDKQLALLMACLTTIAAAVSSASVPAGDDTGDALGDSPFAATAAPTPANGAVPAPPLSLSTYEAAVLAAGPEALSPEPAKPAPAPSAVADERNLQAGAAAPAVVPSIWDGAESARSCASPAVAEEDEAAGRGGGGGDGGGGGVAAQRVIQFALAGLAESGEGDHGGGDDGSGGGGGSGSECTYHRGELSGGSGSEAGDDDGDDGDHDNEEGEGEEGEEDHDETPADATRRRLIAAGFDSLDVDAAMATTGSDNAEVNMSFLLDITPLLPRGAPSDADGLNLRDYIDNRGQNGGGDGGPYANGERGRGAATTANHARSGSSSGSRSNGGGAVRPRARPTAASPVAMGGVSPKWIADVSPSRNASPRPSGGGGLLSRLRRGHKRVPSTASAASEATNDGFEGERSSEQRALSSSSAASAAPRQRASFTSLSSSPVKPHQLQTRGEYARRTTAHVARSHSPPPLRGIGGRAFREFGSGGCVPRVAAGWGEVAPSGPNLRLALVVRLDLGMAPGTVAAQCARAALEATRKAEGRGRADTLAVWREAGESIVVLGVEDVGNLEAVLVTGEASHLSITMVRDKQAGWVGNVRADTCTVAAIGPAPMSALRSVTGGLTVL